ncbi:Protein of unknown function [Sphingomonas gellani]|uniref:Lysozyme inhibitor LprI-like N-terminal domain-containing protein n=1 Tax=Sphingomonas gellani TaxID=1166340 RepID=A0A1H8IPT6_9SPHN|nr:Protein of unknown function [Sphingomonas gellani]
MVLYRLEAQSWRGSGALVLGTMVRLSTAFFAIAATAQEPPPPSGPGPSDVPSHVSASRPASHVPASPANYRSSLSEVPAGELAAYLKANDVQRVPFDSTLATIRTCLRRSEDAIQPCLESRDQACETDTSQCTHAAEDAWQLYIARYLRLLHTALPAETSAASQKAWTAYVDAECEFETAPYPDDPPMRHNVDSSCRAGKAQDRALELRAILIDAES